MKKMNRILLKKIFFCLLVCFISNMLNAQKYENSYLTINIPEGWNVENMDVPGVDMETVVFTNNGIDIYNLGMILGMGQYMEPQYALQSQMQLKSNIIFQNAQFEKIRPSVFMGEKAYTVDFSTVFNGKDFRGAAYAFNKNECTIMAVGCYEVGVKSKLPQVWKSIIWKNYAHTKKYSTLREEIQAYTQSMNELLKKHPVGSDGEEIVSIDLEEGSDCLVYTYRLTEVSKSDFTDEQISAMHDMVRVAAIPLVKQQASQTELLQRCMSNNYVFKYIFRDKDMNFMYSVKVVPDDYNQ